MLDAVQLPAGVADLHAGLAHVDGEALAHSDELGLKWKCKSELSVCFCVVSSSMGRVSVTSNLALPDLPIVGVGDATFHHSSLANRVAQIRQSTD